MHKSVTYLHCKAVEADGERWISAWATTPRQDLIGDVVLPEGAQFTLPIPLLAFHKHDAPIGSVVEASVTRAGIRIKAKLTQGVQRAEEIWRLLCDQAINSVSIGFSILKSTPIAGGGVRVDSWLWHELSCVSVPCNPDAKISIGKSLAYAQTVPAEKTEEPAKPPAYVQNLDVCKDFENACKCLPGLPVSPTRSYKAGDRWQLCDNSGALLGIVAEPEANPVMPMAKGHRPDARQAELLQALSEGVLQFSQHTKAVVARLESRIAELEAMVPMNYMGEHELAYGYARGSVTRNSHGLWIATRDIQPNKAHPQRHGSGWERLT